MDDLQVRALGRAWLVTVAVAVMFTAAVALSHVWDTRVFYRALQDSLAQNEV